MKRHLWILACLSALVAVGCGSDPSKPEVHNPKVPMGSTVAVISFRDCTIVDQDDCKGSGETTAAIFMAQLGTSQIFHVVTLPRPVDAAAELTDQAAADYAKSKGYAFVLNGEVTDYFKAAAFSGWWRKERGALSVHLLSTTDAKILYLHSDQDTANNGTGSPQGIMKSMADDVRDGIEDN